MIERNLIDKSIIKNINSPFFHYKTENEIKTIIHFNGNKIDKIFIENYKELSMNNWELHKKYIKEGHNPSEIARIILNDEIDKFREISSQTNFDFDQYIEPSLYERCSFINKKKVSLIDYAAFLDLLNVLNFLLVNGAKLDKTGKYAVAGGNEEIIHLCEQNHSSFEDAYETAIEFHQNDIFKYLYENKLENLNENMKQKDINDLGNICIKSGNYEIFLYLLEKRMKINESTINEAAKIGNLYLVKHFLQNNLIPSNILTFAIDLGNSELVKYVLEQGVDINAKDIYLFYLLFVLIIYYFKIIFGNFLNYLIQHLFMHL